MAQDLTPPPRVGTIDHRSTSSDVSTAPDLEPVAYLVESWNGMSESWETSIRQSPHSIPDDSDPLVKSVTPLVPLPTVEKRR